jgi:magnesium chelatase subunit H
MPKRTSAADGAKIRFVIVTMDSHLSSATARVAQRLAKEMPGLSLDMHAADKWGSDPAALQRCRSDIARGDIIVATMLFMEDHFRPVLDALQERREHCDAMICAMSAAEVVRLTRLGKFKMDGSQGGAMSLLKRLRGAKKAPAGREKRQPHRRRGSNEDAAADSQNAALHSRHRPRCPGLLLDTAVLAGGFRRQCREYGPLSHRPVCNG